MDYNRWSAGVDPQYPPPPNPNPSSDPYYPHYPHPQSSSYTTHFSSYYHPSNPNTAPPLSSPSHTPLGPPGTESYSSLTPYHPPAAGYSHLAADVGTAAAGYYQEPPVGALSTGVAAGYYKDGTGAGYYQEPTGAHPQSWVVKEAIRQYGADPVAYAPVIELPNAVSMLPSIPINGISHPLANGINKQTKVVQSMLCEVCKLVCNSKDVYDKHILGRKHKRNLILQLNKGSISIPMAVRMPMTVGHSKSITSEDLKTKKQKLMKGGASVDSVMVCSLCNVVCNSQTVFHKHLAGQKHAAQAGTRPPNGIVPSVSTNPVPQFWSNTVSRPPFKNGARQGLNKRKIVQSAWCEVCKIDCTSKEVLDQHKLGKKHKKKVEQLEESKANPTAETTKKPAIGPQENPAGKGKKKVKSTQDPPEDLETKKRKIMEGGVAPDAVKVCEICNVVCNSETVFKFHLAGQKHISLVKQRQSGVVAPGPSAVTAA